MLGATRTQRARTKTRRRAMNGMVCRMKMDKMIQTHGQAVIQTNGTNTVKVRAIIVHPLRNRKFIEFIAEICFFYHSFVDN